MKLKENDIIFSLDGELVNISYDDLSKELSDLKERKILISQSIINLIVN